MAATTKKASAPIFEQDEVFDPEILYNEETELYEYATFSEDFHCICIRFDQMFDKPEIKQHNIFKITFRRYYRILEEIAKDINIILNCENDSARMLLRFNMRMALDGNDEKPYPVEEFYEDIDKFIIEIKDDVVEYVESNYKLELDSVTRKINKDLQVTDDMNKTFIESSICMRIVLPLICTYLSNHSEDKELKNIFYKIFRKVCLLVGDNEINAVTKLQSIITSRIYQTKYSNKKIWKFLTTMSIDMEIVAFDFCNYLLESILPKLSDDRPSIQYLDVVLRQKIDYMFTYNYPRDHKPLKHMEGSDDDNDERDRLNDLIFTNRTDEGSLVLNKLTIKYYINQFIKNYEITEEDIKDFKKTYLKGKLVNEIQNYFLMIYYGNKFEMEVTNEDDRVLLLMSLVYELNDLDFEEIVNMLTSTIEEPKTSSRSRNTTKIKNNQLYLKILDNKYNSTYDIIAKDNFICKMIDFKNYYFLDENNEEIEFTSRYEREVMSFILQSA